MAHLLHQAPCAPQPEAYGTGRAEYEVWSISRKQASSPTCGILTSALAGQRQVYCVKRQREVVHDACEDVTYKPHTVKVPASANKSTRSCDAKPRRRGVLFANRSTALACNVGQRGLHATWLTCNVACVQCGPVACMAFALAALPLLARRVHTLHMPVACALGAPWTLQMQRTLRPGAVRHKPSSTRASRVV